MANPNGPRGLIPYADIWGRPYSGAGNLYFIPASDANNYFIGDPMVPTGTSDANGIPGVTLATAGASNNTVGPIISVTNGPFGGNPLLQSSPVYRQASVATYVLIADDPSALFWIQESGNFGANLSMLNANLLSGTGSTVSGFSGWQLNSSTPATTNTFQLRVLRPLLEADNAIGTNAKWLVRIQNHSITSTTGV